MQSPVLIICCASAFAFVASDSEKLISNPAAFISVLMLFFRCVVDVVNIAHYSTESNVIVRKVKFIFI